MTVTVSADLSSLPGAPEGWVYRKGQQELVDRIVNSPKKVVILQAEPGSGKTLIAWAAIMSALAAQPESVKRITQPRGLILVQTRQLQRQYLKDFRNTRMIEGRRWFTCNLTDEPADMAPCNVGYKCELSGFDGGQEPVCNYFKAKQIAVDADVAVLNYAYWLGESSNFESHFKEHNWIFCDEAHDLQEILMGQDAITIVPVELSALNINALPGGLDVGVMRTWAIMNIDFVHKLREDALSRASDLGVVLSQRDVPVVGTYEDFADADTMDIVDAAEITNLIRRYDKLIASMNNMAAIDVKRLDEWVVDRVRGAVHILPLFGKRGYQRILRAATEKLVLMSAYLAPDLMIKNLDMNPDDVEVIEADEIYNRVRSKIFFCPTFRMNNKTPAGQWRKIPIVLNALAEHYSYKPEHPPGNGLIHVPSVVLRDTILPGMRGKVITYEGSSYQGDDTVLTKDDALADFVDRNNGTQRALLAQSCTTGVDLPYAMVYNVIVKVPFAPIISPAIKARMKIDPDYYPYLTICQLVQAAGRAKRAQDHHCETLILDDSFGWFYRQNIAHFPRWFKKSLVRQGWEHPKFKQLKRDIRSMGALI